MRGWKRSQQTSAQDGQGYCSHRAYTALLSTYSYVGAQSQHCQSRKECCECEVEGFWLENVLHCTLMVRCTMQVQLDTFE